MSKNISKEQIVEVTLNLIKKKEDSRSITIREIAKELGCSHPNIYNYYKSMENILWDCSEEIFLKKVDYSKKNFNNVENKYLKFLTILKNYIDFALDNKGWYKLIWVDKLEGEIPEKTLEKIVYADKQFKNLFLSTFPEISSKESLEEIANIIFGYIHGEIMVYLFKSIFYENRDVFVDSVLKYSLKTIKLFIKHDMEEKDEF